MITVYDFIKVCPNGKVCMHDKNSQTYKTLPLEKMNPYHSEIMKLKIENIREENGDIIAQTKFEKTIWKHLRKSWKE